MGVGPAASVWVPGVRPLAQTKPWSGKGQRPLLRLRRDGERKPVSVKELALNLPGQAWRIVEWREGSNDGLNGRFARVRVHAAHRDNLRAELRPRNGWSSNGPRPKPNRPSIGCPFCPPDIAFDRLLDAIKITLAHRP